MANVLHVVVTGAAAASSQAIVEKTVAGADLWLGFDVYFVADLPGGGQFSANVAELGIDSLWLDGGVSRKWNVGYANNGPFSTVITGQWYHVDFRVVPGSPVVEELWIDSVNQNLTTPFNDNSATTSLRLGADYTGGWETAYELYIRAPAVGTSRGATDVWDGGSLVGNINTIFDTVIQDAGTTVELIADPTGANNDDFVDAIAISGASGSVSGNNTGYTLETGEDIYDLGKPNGIGYGGGRSAWYVWTAPSTEAFVFETSSSGGSPIGDSVLTVCTGAAVNSLAIVAQNDDYTGLYSRVTINATIGTVYHIAVDGYSGVAGGSPTADEGGFLLSWAIAPPRPPYDSIATALPWVQDNLPHTVAFATAGSTDPFVQGVWTKLQFPGWGPTDDASGTVRVEAPIGELGRIRFYRVNNSLFDPSAPNFSMLTLIYTLNGNPDSGTVNVTLPNVGSSQDTNHTIYAVINDQNYNGSVITITMSFPLYLPPDNDDFYDSEYVSNIRGWWPLNLAGSTMQTDEPNHGGVNPVGSVWLTFAPPHTGDLTIRISRVWGGLTDPVLAAYDGFNIAALTPLASDTSVLPSITFPYNASTTNCKVAIAMRDVGDDGGCILEWEYDGMAPNYDYENRVVIAGASGVVNNINLVGAMASIGDPELDYWNSASPSWYEWTCPDDGVYAFTITANGGAAHKSYVRIHTHDPDAPPSGGVTDHLRTVSRPQVTGNFSYTSTSRVTRLNGFSGVKYYIVVYGYADDDVGAGDNPFTLTWTQEGIANDYSVAGGSYTAGGYETIAFGQKALIDIDGDYWQNLEEQDHWLSFYIQYGDANHFTGGPSTANGGYVTFLQMLDSAGSVRFSGNLYSWNYSHELNDVPVFSSPVHADALGFNRVTNTGEQHIEVLFSYGRYAHIWCDGTYCGDAGIGLASGPPYNSLDEIRIGCITDTSPGGTEKTINVRDIKLVSARFYDRPLLDGNVHYGWTTVEGFENKLSASDWINRWDDGESTPVSRGLITLDASSTLGDTPGRGRGFYSDSTSGVGSEMTVTTLDSFLTRRVGWCLYLTDSTTDTVVLAQIGNSNATYLAMLGGSYSGQVMLCDSAFVGIGGDSTWASVKLDTGRWHHIEIAIDPRQVGTVPPHIDWWINGEQQPRRYYKEYYIPMASPTANFNYIGITRVGGVGGAKGWITDVTVGSYDDPVPLGLVKTELLVPNGSGTHVVGNDEDLDQATWPSGLGNWLPADSWMLSTDGGVTHSQIVAATAVHQAVDEWPPIWNGSGTEDFVAELSFSSGGNTNWHTTNPGNYVELLMENPTGSDIVSVSPVLAYRGFWKDVQYSIAGNLIYNAYDLTIATNPSNFTIKLVNSDGENSLTLLFPPNNATGKWTKLNSMIRAPGGNEWTPTSLNDTMVRWGWKSAYEGIIAGFPMYPAPESWGNYYGNGMGNCLLSVALEVASTDTMFSAAPEGYAPSTWDVFSYYEVWGPTVDGTSKNSCEAWGSRLLASTDPNMYTVVWWDPYFQMQDPDQSNRIDQRLFFRVLPAQDPNVPGLDGDFHDTPADEAAGTTSWDYLSAWMYPSGEFVSYGMQPMSWYPTSDQDVEYGEREVYYLATNYVGPSDYPQFESWRWYFDACMNGRLGKWDTTDGSVTLELYAKANDGSVGDITTATWFVERGLCCVSFRPQIYRRVRG